MGSCLGRLQAQSDPLAEQEGGIDVGTDADQGLGAVLLAKQFAGIEAQAAEMTLSRSARLPPSPENSGWYAACPHCIFAGSARSGTGQRAFVEMVRRRVSNQP